MLVTLLRRVWSLFIEVFLPVGTITEGFVF